MIFVFAPNPALERVALVEQNAPKVTTTGADNDLPPGERRPPRPMRVATYAGGAGLRAASVIRLLGGDVLATGFVGGHLGALLRDCLDKQDVPHLLTPIAADTRGDFLVLDRERGIVNEIPEVPPVFTDTEAESLLRSLSRHIRSASLLIVADGPEGDEDSEARTSHLFTEALKIAREANVPVLADISGAAYGAVVEGGVWLLRIGYMAFQRRTERSLRHDSAIIEESRGLLARGVENVVVTIGEEGALLIKADGAWRVKAPIVSHFNPTGSGETLSGALAVQFQKNGGDLVDALCYGCAAASVNVTHDEPGYAMPIEVNVLYPRTIAGPVIAR